VGLGLADSFLTVAEIAELLTINPETIRNWIDRRELSAVRLGSRRVRVKQSDLDRFIEESSAVLPDAGSAASRCSVGDRSPRAVRLGA
jgi:excisionase family DNA binding protein